MEDLLLYYNSSLAPSQEQVDICESGFNKHWKYSAYNYKEIANGQDSLFDNLLELFGMRLPSLYYYYQHDAINKFGVNDFLETERGSSDTY